MEATSSPRAGSAHARPTRVARRWCRTRRTPHPLASVHADQHRNAVPAVSRISADSHTVSTLDA
jgi:hypothetical protein